MRVFDWADPDEMKAAVQFYADNGYAIFDRVASHALCDEVNALCRLHADKDFAPILNLDREEPYIRNLIMKNLTVVDIIEALTGREMVGCQTYTFFKEPGTRYQNQSWAPHQDNSYPQAVAGAYLAVDIALSDQTEDSGIIYVFPGSHKEGLLPFEPRISYREDPDQQPGNFCRVPEKYDKVDTSLKKGQAMVFEGNLCHGSYPNLTNKSRATIVTNYLVSDADMIVGATAQRLRVPLR